MLRKPLFSIAFALAAVLLLTLGAVAQTPEDDEEITVAPLVAEVQQVVPVTLTVVIPSPTGPITLEVPIFLNLDIRIGIGSDLTATVAATPSLTLTGTAPIGLATAVPEEEATDEEAAPEPTTEPVVVAPTATPALPTATPLPPTPTTAPLPTPTPTPEPPPVVVAPSCPDPRAVITSPGVNQVVAGPSVTILGTATHAQFQYYKLEIAAGANADSGFTFLGDVRVPVNDGVLGSLDSTGFANGAYTLRVTVVDNTGNFPPPCSVSIVIQN